MINSSGGEIKVSGTIAEIMADLDVAIVYLFSSVAKRHGIEAARQLIGMVLDDACNDCEKFYQLMQAEETNKQ